MDRPSTGRRGRNGGRVGVSRGNCRQAIEHVPAGYNGVNAPHCSFECGALTLLLLRCNELALESCSNESEVVIAMPNGMILEHELTGERRVRVKRHGSRAIEVVIG